MPFPPPPPPPPATFSGTPPPPPPGLPAFGGGGGGKKVNPAQARDNLLQSIRQGKSLKKTVTIDKSKPLIDNSPKTPVKCNGTVKNGEMSSLASRIPNGLAELFAGGSMPKLKPTGLAITGQSKSPQSINSSPVSLLNQTTINNLPSNTNTLPLQKKNNGPRKMPNDINTRGPPPQPPLLTQKPTIPSSTSEPVSIIPPGVGHNRTGSVPSLVSDNVMGSKGPPPGGYGKPNVAPKPPSIRPAVPIIKSQLVASSTDLVPSADGRNHVTRAHSMRIPRTPPAAPNTQPPQFNNMTINYKNQPPAFHQSQDSILRSTSNTTRNPQWGSRTLRPIKHPSTRPPPPPIRAPLNPPVCAPPLPPPFRSVPPTPPLNVPPIPPPNVPPHKSHSNNNVTNGAPPTPPTRHSSMRNGPTSVKSLTLLEEMEMKFSGMFKPIIGIPPPPIFQRVDKIYNSRLVVSKHQAPKPPGY